MSEEYLDIIGKEFPQKCGDSLKIIKKTDKRGPSGILFECEFQKYPYKILKEKKHILSGSVLNPQIEQVEFIDKIWPQNCNDSLKIISKSNKKDYWNCEFIKYPCKVCVQKCNILKGNVSNPQIEIETFRNKIWKQNCNDSLKIIKKLEERQGSNCLYECEFIKYPYKIKAQKNHIIEGSVVNPLIEENEFIKKEFLQNCGYILKVIEKEKDSNLYKCEFVHTKYKGIVFANKVNIKLGNVDNIHLPYKNKESFKIFLEERKDKKYTLEELAKEFNVQNSHISNLIIRFGLKEYIKYWPTQSKEEIYLREYLNSIYNKEILYSNWDILENKEIDIYIPNLKLGFEYNGNYWHSNVYKEQNYHQEKSLECNKKGIKLFHIFGYELDLKENIIKSLIKSKLNLFDKRFYARKCEIKEIQYKEYANFCNENHLQGECGAKVKLGLFYNEELIQIMSFGKPRFTDKYEWEIIRECSKLGYIIIGGKEKLWKYFLRKFNPNNCISYCDFSKFTGNSYLKLGFKLKQLNKPGFVWYDKVKDCVYWRNPSKHQEYKDKYFQIYDCGQLVFEWYK